MVINADSMQVYRDLHVLTARPTAEEEAAVTHRLYGHVDAAVNFSAAPGCPVRPKYWKRRAHKTGCRFSSAAPASISRR
jgi:hypothetical protein